MPVEFESTFDIAGDFYWSFDVYGGNGKYLCGGSGYNTKRNAMDGAKAALKELQSWADLEKSKSSQSKKSGKKATSGRLKPVAKPSTRSSSQIRKTVRQGG